MSETESTPRRITFGSLNGLRFLLAIWIAWFHVGHMFDDAGMGSVPLLRMGAVRVDIFFVLSGFVLAHVYWNRTNKTFNYLDFMVARLARIYPMYLLAIGLVATYLIAGALLGQSPDRSYPFSDFHRLSPLVAVFRRDRNQCLNFPAWAVSAELGGYLLFPVFLWIADRFKRMPWAMLGFAVLIILIGEIISRRYFHLPLNQAVTDWGALRGAVMIFCGVAARVAYTGFLRGRESSVVTVVFGALATAAIAVNNWGLPLIGFSASMMMIGLARLDLMEEFTPLSTPTMQKLGSWSYAIFILHAPVYTIVTSALGVVGVDYHPNVFNSLMLVSLVVLIAGPVTHFVETPARLWLREKWEQRRGRKLRTAGV